jgi:hypothetical protein
VKRRSHEDILRVLVEMANKYKEEANRKRLTPRREIDFRESWDRWRKALPKDFPEDDLPTPPLGSTCA